MSGSHQQLSSACKSMVDQSIQEPFGQMLDHILNSQFVTIPHLEHQWWHVQRGSGMGMICSGDVSDVALWQCMESTTVDCQEWRKEHGVFLYCRYRDDILMVIDDDDQVRDRVMSALSKKSSVFTLELENESKVCGVSMLDCFVSKRWLHPDSRDAVLFVKPFTKPTSIWRPLCSTSLHPDRVHLSWPVTFLQRLESRASYHKHAKQACVRFASRFLSQCPGHIVAQDLIRNARNARRRPCTLVPRHERQSGSRDCSWLVLPYRRAWESSTLKRDLARLADVFYDLPSPRIAWSKGGKHHVSLLTGLNSKDILQHTRADVFRVEQ